MMRICAYFLILAGLFFVPVERLDVAQLEPVEIVYVAQDDATVTISTDTGAQGVGEDVMQALEMLHTSTPGVVYLHTAEYLLFNRQAAKQVEQLREHLHSNVRICLSEAIDFKDLAKYLGNHGDLPCLGTWKSGDPLPELKNGKIGQKAVKTA